MHTVDDVKKSLKATGIIDVICAVIFLILAVLMIVAAVGAMSAVGEESEYQAGEVTLTFLMVIISALMWIVSIILFVLFAISLGFGINSLVVSKRDFEVMKRRRGGLIAGAVFGVIGCIIFAVMVIASVVAIAKEPSATGVIPVVVAALAFVVVILSTIFKIRSAKLLKSGI